jgi:uncharacterized membrane protein
MPSALTDLGSDPHQWLTSSHFIMLALIGGFAFAHSGLASLRLEAEKRVGPRLYRVLFALVSISLAVVLIIYFVNHRYDGVQLWQVQGQSWVLPLVWVLSATSFIFLYPSTFNLLEIAAVFQPKVHLHKTGIVRITRHPQMVGQVIWCVAHTLWVGTTFTLATSLGLIGYHLFAVWHGDRRLLIRYGDAFEDAKAKTSVMPFLAIAQGRQTFNFGEFVRPAYLGIAVFVGLFWWVHPVIIRAAAGIHW